MAKTAKPEKSVKKVKPAKRSKAVKSPAPEKAADGRALEYAKILSRMVQYDTTSHPFSQEYPAEATLGANMRFVHHQDMEESLALIRRLAAKFDLEMEVLDAAPCTRLADINGTAFRYVEQIVKKTFPGMGTSPYVLTAATDSAFYDCICDNCIRFAPIVYGPEEKKGIHGTNEALRYDCLPGAVDFYKNLITGNTI